MSGRHYAVAKRARPNHNGKGYREIDELSGTGIYVKRQAYQDSSDSSHSSEMEDSNELGELLHMKKRRATRAIDELSGMGIYNKRETPYGRASSSEIPSSRRHSKLREARLKFLLPHRNNVLFPRH